MTARVTRKRARPELLRAGFRTIFFAVFALLALMRHPYAVAPALAAGGAGLLSLRLARWRGNALAHTFVCLDYLLLGVALALAGGCSSWFLLVIPFHVFGQLVMSPRRDWPFVVAPTLLLVVVLAIADSSLGGDRAAGLAKLFVLVVAGGIAAHEASRPRLHKHVKVQSVCPTTGFYTKQRLRDVMTQHMRAAVEHHDPLTVVCLRLDHFADTRAFLGAQGSELLVRGVAHRIERHLCSDDAAVRVAPDTFVLGLMGRTSAEARAEAEAICHDVAGQLIDRRRQTLRFGISSFPTIRHLEPLLQDAYENMTMTGGVEGGAQVAPQALPVAVAQ
jgi:diguanylate cyclase (GGDEF)-like protein